VVGMALGEQRRLRGRPVVPDCGIARSFVNSHHASIHTFVVSLTTDLTFVVLLTQALFSWFR